MTTSLFVFSNDLRLSDNRALLEAAQQSTRLICLFCVDPAWFRPARYYSKSIGAHRWQFLHQSLKTLESELNARHQTLLIRFQSQPQAIEQLINAHAINVVYRSHNSGFRERQAWEKLKQRFSHVAFREVTTFTLFDQSQLPFTLDHLPDTFTQFRKQVENFPISEPLVAPDILPRPMTGLNHTSDRLPPIASTESPFTGGEIEGLSHINHYFSTQAPANYKETRNELSGWECSTHFSPWLAQGCISARQINADLKRYETEVTTNESTAWILFELLWREYFQWCALKHGTKLFAPCGIHNKKKRCCFYAERFQKWCAGNTPWPIVNACMKELKATGYLSNRGRQLAASCFINELGLDWRYGAAWFEEQLIDYDVASNWGNWQYIAGVGADPRGGRHFDLAKQTQLYDTNSRYINQWQGYPTSPLDSVDAADWPILPPDVKSP
ncbi:DASH family cryptochrome [uncultured Endozoicomonas sp.]|uniref:DASH family cryptochrome n=1 Tax=uncultured Endozoicomonas sp. TaxID=432652 RepID=UPI002621C157|nr:DASH family cryptochrome [uncultured Endozoicomonas sp.]